MGIETILFAAFTGLKAFSQIKQGKEQAKRVTQNAEAQAAALREEGRLAASERAKKARYKAARQTVSFLNSGLTLEGTPSSVIQKTYDVGIEDVGNITRGYNTRISNVISGANADSKDIISSSRSEAIGTIASSFAGSSFGGSGMFSAGGFTVPGTGAAPSMAGNVPIPGIKPSRINLWNVNG